MEESSKLSGKILKELLKNYLGLTAVKGGI